MEDRLRSGETCDRQYPASTECFCLSRARRNSWALRSFICSEAFPGGQCEHQSASFSSLYYLVSSPHSAFSIIALILNFICASSSNIEDFLLHDTDLTSSTAVVKLNLDEWSKYMRDRVQMYTLHLGGSMAIVT